MVPCSGHSYVIYVPKALRLIPAASLSSFPCGITFVLLIVRDQVHSFPFCTSSLQHTHLHSCSPLCSLVRSLRSAWAMPSRPCHSRASTSLGSLLRPLDLPYRTDCLPVSSSASTQMYDDAPLITIFLQMLIKWIGILFH